VQEKRNHGSDVFYAISCTEKITSRIIFDRRMIWRLHIERTAAKALDTYIRTHSVFKSDRVSINNKLILYKALISSIKVYVSPTWEYVADAHLLKLERLQNKVLHATDGLERRTMAREMHVAFKIPYVYDYIIKLCRKQAEVIQNL
jgi:hypothetical protein